MSNPSTEVSIKSHSAVFNHGIKLNPCMGCIYRGNCEGEKYVKPGDFCHSKKERKEVY